LKFIDREGRNNWDVRRRFHHEAKAAAQLRSPHVVQILDHGEWESIPYIAMEYLEGEDLAHRLHRVGRLSWGETCRIASHVARALGKAHAAGIVHRDVKPENIFLVRDDDNEIAKVLDFGIAQHATSEPNGAGRSILGTPFYMSPEQASGTTRVDHRSDLFSLAVIVYQCLTGELPFVGEGVQDVFSQILQGPVPIPSQKAADLPPTFDAWWARASARDVSQRYQTAKEFAEALNLSLRISEVLEIASLMPRAEISSAGRISIVAGSLSALGSPQISGGPTLAIHNTLDESFPDVRTRAHLPQASASALRGHRRSRRRRSSADLLARWRAGRGHDRTGHRRYRRNDQPVPRPAGISGRALGRAAPRGTDRFQGEQFLPRAPIFQEP
jgi:serine/threonine-protein kinase